MIIDTLRREADIWTAIDRWPMFVDALLERLTAIDAQGQYCAELATLLLERAGKGHLSEEEEEDIRALVAKHSIVCQTSYVCIELIPADYKSIIRRMGRSTREHGRHPEGGFRSRPTDFGEHVREAVLPPRSLQFVVSSVVGNSGPRYPIGENGHLYPACDPLRNPHTRC